MESVQREQPVYRPEEGKTLAQSREQKKSVWSE